MNNLLDNQTKLHVTTENVQKTGKYISKHGMNKLFSQSVCSPLIPPQKIELYVNFSLTVCKLQTLSENTYHNKVKKEIKAEKGCSVLDLAGLQSLLPASNDTVIPYVDIN